MTEVKRVTLKISTAQHKAIKGMSRPNDLTQEELLGLMIDVITANPKAIEPHIARYKARRAAEQQRQKEMANKAANLVNSLPPELQEKLLSGALDAAALEKLLK